ncbi:hypothetical protein ACTXT7_016548 [Hymenolepis weldensis]
MVMLEELNNYPERETCMKDFHIINPHHHAGYGAICTTIEIVLTGIDTVHLPSFQLRVLYSSQMKVKTNWFPVTSLTILAMRRELANWISSACLFRWNQLQNLTLVMSRGHCICQSVSWDRRKEGE